MAMSLFGKLKNLQSGPPAPSRRTETNAGWPQDDFLDDEGDMYEVPPCEPTALQVSQKHLEDNFYLERSINPAIPMRQAAPSPTSGRFMKSQQQAEGPFNDPRFSKPPEIDRSEKPGRKKKPALPAMHSPSPPLVEEDVYLDPNEEQEEGDDVYLEPTEARHPAPRGPMRTPPSPQTRLGTPRPVPMPKPPVPRAKSNSILPSLNEVKTAEMRRSTLPAVLPPPPAPSVRPPLPANLKEAKAREERLGSPPIPVVTDTRTGAFSSGVRTLNRSGTEGKEWFAGDCNRKTAEALLLRVNRDGAFLIRHSSSQSSRQPYTLAVLYKEKVYNIPIRFLEELRGYALGKEGKTNEEIFSTLDEMISHHRHNQLLLINSKSQAKHTTYLTHPARP